MNLIEQMGYQNYINTSAIAIADEIENEINYYTEEQKKEFIERLNNEDYYELQEWIQSYLSDINSEIMIILSKKLGFEY